MVHYQCFVCHMTATCVVTPGAELAWLDHMGTHARPEHYGSWAWTVQQLHLEV